MRPSDNTHTHNTKHAYQPSWLNFDKAKAWSFCKTTSLVAAADICVSLPLLHLANLQQYRPTAGLLNTARHVLRHPYKGMLFAYPAKWLSRGSGIVIASPLIPSRNVQLSDVTAASLVASGSETFFTTTLQAYYRIFTAKKVRPSSQTLRKATLSVTGVHALKNVCTYLPVFAMAHYVNRNPNNIPWYACFTALAVQPFTTVLDTLMTARILAAHNAVKPPTLKTIIRDHILTSHSMLKLIGLRCMAYGLGYFAIFKTLEIIKRYQETAQTIEPDNVQTTNPEEILPYPTTLAINPISTAASPRPKP